MATRPDTEQVEALDASYIKPAFICYLDILGDPVRATTWPADLTFVDTGDPDLDGHTFQAMRREFIDISEVKFSEGGTETVTCTLSGLILPDNDLLNTVNDRSNWQGRPARLWRAIYNENDVRQGTYWNYYTGRMVGMPISGDPDQQVIELTIETYLASLSSASNRTLLDQQDYDPGDLSAAAAIAIANGNSGNGLAGGGGYGGGGGGGGLSGWIDSGGGGFAGNLMRQLMQ